MNKFVLFAFFALTTFASSNAFASFGTIEGRLTFYNNQGNYCPTTRNCAGAQYLQSEFNSNLGIRNVKVYMFSSVWPNRFLGSGVSDSDGNFSIFWDDPDNNNQGYVVTYLEESSGRFHIRDNDLTNHRLFSGNFNLTPGTSSGSPQDVGTFNWGTAANPSAMANLYDGAWRTWYKAFNYSSRMRTHFTNIDVFGLDPQDPLEPSRTCNTSCAVNPATGSDYIIIDSINSAYSPQARIMHEMGHIASTLSSPGQDITKRVNYCWPNTTGTGCGWNMTSSEWGASQFEEGLATFYGDVAIYWMNNPEPHTCLRAALPCATGTLDVEDSTCSSGDNRQAVGVVRYLRDLYDTTSEGTWDDTNEGYFHFFDVMNTYESGSTGQFGNRGYHEPFSSLNPLVVDDEDGRSAYDFYYYWEQLHSNNDYTVRSNNCLAGVGDY